MKHIITFLVLLLSASQIAHAQAGFLDTTFGDKGITAIEFNDRNPGVFDIVVLPNQKILLSTVLWSKDSGSKLLVTRFDQNGKIDSGFGVKGSFTFVYAWNINTNKILLYPDGRILAYGSVYPASSLLQPYVIRVLPNGSLDSTFGDNGIYIETSYDLLGHFELLKIREDGSILAIGERGIYNGSGAYYYPSITLLTPNGTRDSSFGNSGMSVVKDVPNYTVVVDCAFDIDGNCYFGCGRFGSNGRTDFIIKTNINGVLDSSFGNNGFVEVSIHDSTDELRSILLQDDGKILCLVNTKENDLYRVSLLRLNSDGKPDILFGDLGASSRFFKEDFSFGNMCVIDSHKKYMVVGLSYIIAAPMKSFASAFRVDADGLLDTSFGSQGASVLRIFDDADAEALAVQSNGKYIVAAIDGRKALVYRLNNVFTSRINDRNTLRNNREIDVHPTPSTNNCTVTYTLPSSSQCTITLRDESGREVRVFAEDEYRIAGEHKEELDLRGLAAGVYFLQIESNGTVQSAKLLKK